MILDEEFKLGYKQEIEPTPFRSLISKNGDPVDITQWLKGSEITLGDISVQADMFKFSTAYSRLREWLLLHSSPTGSAIIESSERKRMHWQPETDGSTYRAEAIAQHDRGSASLPSDYFNFEDNAACTVSDFSSGSRRYFIKGELNGTPVEALPDTGAEMCFISNTLASSLDLRIVPRTRKKILLANKKSVQSPGMVVVPWKFEGEREKHTLNCWILPECVHDLVLGCHFLRGTQTLTKFLRRIRSELVSLPRRLRLRFLGEENQRLWGYLDDNFTAALPDTGSDVMVISRAYARKLGLAIDHDTEKLLEVEFADGTTTWTSGVVRNIPWSVGGKTVRCDFHVLDDLCVDVILSNDYLFNMNIFAECEDYFFESNLEEDLSRFCNIRLLGRYGESLNLLEEEYLNDVTSLDAFTPEKIQRELARRDQIRDEISALPEEQREAATLDEIERQNRWEALRRAHQTRLESQSQSQSSVSQQSNGHVNVSEMGERGNRTQISGSPVDVRFAGANPQRKTSWKTRWKTKIGIPTSSR